MLCFVGIVIFIVWNLFVFLVDFNEVVFILVVCVSVVKFNLFLIFVGLMLYFVGKIKVINVIVVIMIVEIFVLMSVLVLIVCCIKFFFIFVFL